MITKTMTTTIKYDNKYYYVHEFYDEVLRRYCKQHTSKRHSNSKPVKAIKRVKCC